MDKNSFPIIPAQPGMLQDLTFRAKLILRLMIDKRVSWLVKLLPLAGLAYWLIPWPGDSLIPVVDDAALVWLTSYFFIEFCPPTVIREHVHALTDNNTIVDGAMRGEPESEDVIEGEVKEE